MLVFLRIILFRISQGIYLYSYQPPYYACFLFHYAYQKLKAMNQRSSLLTTKITMHVCVYRHDRDWSTLRFLFGFAFSTSLEVIVHVYMYVLDKKD